MAARSLIRAGLSRRAFSGAPMVADSLVSVTFVKSTGERFPVQGFLGSTVAETAQKYGLMFEGATTGLINQKVHSDAWTEDLFGEGPNCIETHVVMQQNWFNAALIDSPLLPVEDDLMSMLDEGVRTTTCVIVSPRANRARRTRAHPSRSVRCAAARRLVRRSTVAVAHPSYLRTSFPSLSLPPSPPPARASLTKSR